VQKSDLGIAVAKFLLLPLAPCSLPRLHRGEFEFL